MTEAKPALSIIITSHTTERLEDISKLLDSLRTQSCPGVEIVFVADQSSELAVKVQEYASLISLPIRVLLNQGEAGVNVCRNIGIMASHSEVLGLVGVILSALGVGLTPVCGVGLLILPIGLAFLLVAGLIAEVL